MIISGPDAPIEDGNALPLSKIPLNYCSQRGTDSGRGAQIVRAAGAQVVKEGDYVTLLPSEKSD